jgi:valyl-tRNA synthetase
VTGIRSTKVDLNASPGAYIDISTDELSNNHKSIIKDNSNVLKRLGRISNIHDSKINKNGIKIIVSGASITLYFDQNLDLGRQRQNISNRVKDLDQKLIQMVKKLKNKSFLKNAPKQIIEKDKKALMVYKFELKKFNSILNSIKKINYEIR